MKHQIILLNEQGFIAAQKTIREALPEVIVHEQTVFVRRVQVGKVAIYTHRPSVKV